MKLKTIMSLFALALIGLVFSAGLASAYRGDYTVRGPDCDDERHALMMDAFNELDYEVWKELMVMNGKSSRVLQVINENNFGLFVQAHNAGKEGNYELANQLRLELGLNNGIGPKNGFGFGKIQNIHEMKGLGQGAGHGRLYKNK